MGAQPGWGVVSAPRRPLLAAFLILAAAAAPVAAAAIVNWLGASAARYEALSVGTLSALAVGGLAGIKRGGLWALLSGPAIGFVVGLVDLRVFVWLYTNAEWPIPYALAFPTWGLLFGIWTALHRRRWWSRLLSVVLLAGVDLAARLAWTYGVSPEMLAALGDWRWLFESLIYTPPAVCLLLLMPRLPRRSTSKQADN